jgi:two-component system chemotaxis response regulator CheB
MDAAHYRNDLKLDVDVAACDSAYEKGIMGAIEPSVYTCPDCHGVLFRIREGKTDRFRCHTGHGYSSNALLAQQKETAESSLWQAVKTLQESGALLHELTERMRKSGEGETAEALGRKAGEVEERLKLLRQLALAHTDLPDKRRA